MNRRKEEKKTALQVWFREQDKYSPVCLHGTQANMFPEPDPQCGLILNPENKKCNSPGGGYDQEVFDE